MSDIFVLRPGTRRLRSFEEIAADYGPRAVRKAAAAALTGRHAYLTHDSEPALALPRQHPLVLLDYEDALRELNGGSGSQFYQICMEFLYPESTGDGAVEVEASSAEEAIAIVEANLNGEIGQAMDDMASNHGSYWPEPELKDVFVSDVIGTDDLDEQHA